MTYSELTPSELVRILDTAGRYPDPELISAIWDRRAATEPLLLALFDESFDDTWSDPDDPRWYRFIHAGKFLLSWQNSAALPTFARLYGSQDDDMLNWCEWFEEDLYQFGPAAIPYLKSVVTMDSGGVWHYGKGLSSSILTRIATYYPETREEVAAIFRSQLPAPDAFASLTEPDEMLGALAAELGVLADEASREHILALDDVGMLFTEFFERQAYLRDMKHGYKPQTPPPPYDIRAEYRKRFESNQAERKRAAQEQERQRAQQSQPASRQAMPKIGRNDPCPCGSGLKYKKCHGRPGA